MNPEFKEILFLDIETVAISEKYAQLDERLKAQWARKASFFKREELNNWLFTNPYNAI